jgi:putative transposase
MNEMNVRKTYEEKLRPTPEQERQLAAVLWRCRALYNVALEQRLTWWRRGQGRSVTRFQQEAELKDLRAAFPEYAAIHSHVHSHVLQDVLARLDKTYQAFFRRVVAGEKKAGFPRYQGRNRYHSYTFKEYGNGARLDNGFLVLSKIGRIAVRWSRPVAGVIKPVRVSKEADGWYVCFSCDEVPVRPLPPTGQEMGIDVGLKVFLITADGDAVDNLRHYRKGEKALKKAQQRVSRRKQGSKRRAKAVRILAKRHQRVRRQRQDFHHKTARSLVRRHDIISVESIQPANLSGRPEPRPDGNEGYERNGASRKAGLNKSMQDAGWRQFLSILAYKAACAGKRVEAVNPAYMSQDCSACGACIQMSLSVRTHVCTNFGLVLDRDENAARHILWRGQRLRGLAGLPAGMNREPAGL